MTTTADPQASRAVDLVDRRFYSDGPNRLRVADITYIPTWSGSLYLAMVLDVYSRRIAGWAMETHLKTELILAAMEMALTQRRPEAVIHHWCDALHGNGWRCLRQCDGGELLRHTRA